MIKNKKDLAQFCQEKHISLPSISYSELIESLGVEILIKEDEADYQGDSLLLLKEKNGKKSRYGFLIFGWGSCSLCDALQACNNIKDYENLRDALDRNIIWKKTKEEIIKYIFEEKQFEMTHLVSSYDTLIKQFKEKVKDWENGKLKEKETDKLIYKDDDSDKESPFSKLRDLVKK